MATAAGGGAGATETVVVEDTAGAGGGAAAAASDESVSYPLKVVYCGGKQLWRAPHTLVFHGLSLTHSYSINWLQYVDCHQSTVSGDLPGQTASHGC